MAPITQDTKFIDIFRTFFVGFNFARLKTLAELVQAISSVRSVNLVKVAAGMHSKSLPDSSYRRIQRFIHDIRLDPKLLAPYLLRLAGIKAPYTLIMDRTNWEFGKAKINFLMLSVLGNGWSIPILWMLLPKKGNSNEEERIELMNRFIHIFGKGVIYNLLADREFIGDTWMGYLIEALIPFDIRIRANMNVLFKGRMIRVSRLFRNSNPDRPVTIFHQVMIGTNQVYLQGQWIINSKTNRKEWLIICTYCQPGMSIKRYAERWYIENMFKDMKSNGFQLECTHLTRIERLDTLMSILAIAYTWMIRIGMWVKKVRPRIFKKKKHGRPAKSIFRGGLDEFMHSIHTLNFNLMRKWMKFLSCT
jgi:hypothetical protein